MFRKLFHSPTESVSIGVAESAAACKEITKNVYDVNQVLNETSNGAMQSKEAGESLTELAQQMEQVISQFKTNNGDGQPEPVTTHAS
jgi:methyl-accepting chemotaxis protein